MAGMFGLSVDSQRYKGSFFEDFFWGQFYQQHFGKEHAGVALHRGGGIIVDGPRSGLFRSSYSGLLPGVEATEGIGYCGSEREPFSRKTKTGTAAACFSGNITNAASLFFDLSTSLKPKSDIELLLDLILQSGDINYGIINAGKEVEGSFALFMLTPEGIRAVSYPGHWPLMVGRKEGAVALATDSSCFGNLGFTYDRCLDPGEIVMMRNGDIETQGHITNAAGRLCSFLWVYTWFPAAICMGVPASAVRKGLGAALASRDIADGHMSDIIMPISYSGDCHGIGYLDEWIRQMNEGSVDKVPFFDMPLVRYPHAGRSFTPQEQIERLVEAMMKQVPNGERYDGKSVTAIDDSIVRGTQTEGNLVPKLRGLGFSEISFAISYPELCSCCPWGKTTKKDGDLLAVQAPDMATRIKRLGVDRLRYNSVEDLLTVFADLGLSEDQLCIDCTKRRDN